MTETAKPKPWSALTPYEKATLTLLASIDRHTRPRTAEWIPDDGLEAFVNGFADQPAKCRAAKAKARKKVRT